MLLDQAWHNRRTIHRVGVPEGPRAHIRKALEDIVAVQEEGGADDASNGMSGTRRGASEH